MPSVAGRMTPLFFLGGGGGGGGGGRSRPPPFSRVRSVLAASKRITTAELGI